MNYKDLISKLKIVNKEGHVVPFDLKPAQADFLDKMSGKDYILKCRQIGFSSLILAIFTWDFLLKENSRSVCISHDAQAAQKLLDRVKYYIKTLEDQGVAIGLKYNSRNELVNADKNSSFYIGQAGSKSFGRGDTLTNLHLSELAFYPYPEETLASAMQAVVPSGRTIIETTANGFNFGKQLWDKTILGETPFKAHFYNPVWEYSEDYLNEQRQILDRTFSQEYPMTAIEAFISSGQNFFSKDALSIMLDNCREPMQPGDPGIIYE